MNPLRLTLCLVSTHAPVWGATAFVNGTSKTLVFQLTRPCGARRLASLSKTINTLVSTHAPVWGATYSDKDVDKIVEVSTHAPVWGATVYKCAVSS